MGRSAGKRTIGSRQAWVIEPTGSPRNDQTQVLAKVLRREYSSKMADALIAVAATGLFVDICAASTGRSELLAVVNQQLRSLGLELVPLARH